MNDAADITVSEWGLIREVVRGTSRQLNAGMDRVSRLEEQAYRFRVSVTPFQRISIEQFEQKVAILTTDKRFIDLNEEGKLSKFTEPTALSKEIIINITDPMPVIGELQSISNEKRLELRILRTESVGTSQSKLFFKKTYAALRELLVDTWGLQEDSLKTIIASDSPHSKDLEFEQVLNIEGLGPQVIIRMVESSVEGYVNLKVNEAMIAKTINWPNNNEEVSLETTDGLHSKDIITHHFASIWRSPQSVHREDS